MKEKNKKRKWGLWCLEGIIVLGLVAVVGFGFLIYTLSSLGNLYDGASQCDTVEMTPSGLEQITQITLPLDIDNFSMQCSGFMDHLDLSARFDIDAQLLDEVEEGIESIENWPENPLLTDDMLRPLDRIVERRQIEQMRSYIFGTSTSYSALIDTSNDETYTVYLSVFLSF